MYSPSDGHRKRPGVRVRPVPERGHCLVYTPDRPTLHWLNPGAWLILELCQGQPLTQMVAAYHEATGLDRPREEVVEELSQGLTSLRRRGIIEPVSAPSKSRRLPSSGRRPKITDGGSHER